MRPRLKNCFDWLGGASWRRSSTPKVRLFLLCGVFSVCRLVAVGGAEGDMPEEMMTLDCVLNIDLKDNRPTGERGTCACGSA